MFRPRCFNAIYLLNLGSTFLALWGILGKGIIYLSPRAEERFWRRGQAPTAESGGGEVPTDGVFHPSPVYFFNNFLCWNRPFWCSLLLLLVYKISSLLWRASLTSVKPKTLNSLYEYWLRCTQCVVALSVVCILQQQLQLLAPTLAVTESNYLQGCYRLLAQPKS